MLVDFIRDYTRDYADTMFWIAGRTNPAKAYRDEARTRFLGELSAGTLARYLRMADVYLHMPEFSWCDNSLVEAICAGCYPIGSNVGGNAEIIRAVKGGIVDCDTWRKPEFVSEYFPGPIDWAGTRCALERARCRPQISCMSVHIANVARQYRKVFEMLLS